MHTLHIVKKLQLMHCIFMKQCIFISYTFLTLHKYKLILRYLTRHITHFSKWETKNFSKLGKLNI